ncbi:MAG TPA: cupredoxin domain-containing protein [Myxococcota bacterium]|nr:cupredoxin domain-containing protein [Myxococcota bacterium]
MRGAARAWWLASPVLASLLVLASAPSVARAQGFTDDRSAVQVVSAKIGTKNVFIPSTIVLTAGKGRTLSIFNDTDTPHGFKIAALGVEAVLQPGQETKIDLPPLEGGHVYEINCQLHPPHRHATLVVLDAK